LKSAIHFSLRTTT